MLTKKFAVALIACAMTTVLAGCSGFQFCTGAGAEADPIGTAVKLDGWDNVNNLYQDGRFYFAGQPARDAFERFAADEGIRTVINLRQPAELESLDFDEPVTVNGLGMRYVNLPVVYSTLTDEYIDAFAAELAKTQGPVLIHCGSSNRVGAVWGAYLVKNRGFEIDEAAKRGQAAGMTKESSMNAFKQAVGTP